MRNKIIELINEKEKRSSIFLTADMGFSVLEKTKKLFKNFFFNVGVAENNMLLIACGLEESLSRRVYCYSISPFVTLRTFEVIRNFISNDNRNIRIIGVGSGVSYAEMGKTHFNFDDINSLYSLKNILILNPANVEELDYLFKKFLKYNKPIYFRINKFNFHDNLKFKKINNIFLKRGKLTNLVTSGAVLNHILKNLNKEEIDLLNIISVPIIHHDYNKNIIKFFNKKNKTVFLCDSSKTLFFEELKSSINSNNKIINFDCNHNCINKVGGYDYILNSLGLNRKNLLKLLF